jgi:3-phosphoshikimate 1-carboxyvinyltransferase
MVHLLHTIEKNRRSSTPVRIDCGPAGTTFRFLTALLAATPGKWLITGSGRMKERPIGILVECLKKLGAQIGYLEKIEFPPLLIEGKELKGGHFEIDASVSSQFISALILIAPTINGGLSLKLADKVSSRPYIEMTLKLLEQFGIRTSFNENLIKIEQQDYQPGDLTIEPDWTSAVYWYEMAAFASEVNFVLKGLKKESIQGDSILPEIFTQFGVNTEFMPDGIRLTKTKEIVSHFNFDFSQYPDLAQAVIVTCAGLNIPGKFTGLDSLRIKETDRFTALGIELEKLNYKIKADQNSEIINLYSKPETSHQKPVTSNQHPGTRNPELINTYGDHRMALAFAPMALVLGSLQIENPGIVTKSYPGFWEDLKNSGFILA